MKPLKVKCPAKLNLFLDISFRMPNGYHIMEMVMQSVNLFDTLYLTLDSSGEIGVAMENSPIPGDQKNIAYRCAQALLEAAGSSQGVHIRIHKEIPAQAGLGGGSADGAGVLVGLNHLLGSPLNLQQLCDLGAAIGSDIPFASPAAPLWCGALARLSSPSSRWRPAICSLPSPLLVWIQPSVSAAMMRWAGRFPCLVFRR